VTRALAALAAIVVVVVGFGAWLFYFGGTSHPAKAAAIVVLSGDTRRIATGERLFDEHVAPNLLVSLYDLTPRALCAERNVTCFRAHPFSTQGEAETVARVARANRWKSLIVVSSRYHLRRAHMLFDRCTDASVQTVPAPSSFLRYVRGAVLEVPKWAYQLTFDRGC
jgi:uncharacterized SAM-binding protein YcdF (DUF218 family)